MILVTRCQPIINSGLQSTAGIMHVKMMVCYQHILYF